MGKSKSKKVYEDDDLDHIKNFEQRRNKRVEKERRYDFDDTEEEETSWDRRKRD